MKVKAYEISTGYYVSIWDKELEAFDIYEMSSNANMPNGVCIYAGRGDVKEMQDVKEIVLGDLPKGVLLQIITVMATA